MLFLRKITIEALRFSFSIFRILIQLCVHLAFAFHTTQPLLIYYNFFHFQIEIAREIEIVIEIATVIENVIGGIGPDRETINVAARDLVVGADIENGVENAADPVVPEKVNHVAESHLYIGTCLHRDSNMFLHYSIKQCKVKFTVHSVFWPSRFNKMSFTYFDAPTQRLVKFRQTSPQIRPKPRYLLWAPRLLDKHEDYTLEIFLSGLPRYFF